MESLVSILCLLATAWASPPARLTTNSVSAEPRVVILDEVWQTIRDHYYSTNFNGVDWPVARERYRSQIEAAANDYEFHKLLRRMVAELRDSHTHYDLPPDVSKPIAFNVGLTVELIEGELVVSRVESGCEAAKQGARPGMIVRTVDGVQASERLAFVRNELRKGESCSSERVFEYEVRQLFFFGDAGTVATIALAEDAGSVREIRVPRRNDPISWSAPPFLTARRLSSGLGYIRFNHWSPSLKRKLQSELKRFASAPGLVIDLRENVGGDIDFNLETAGYFFEPGTRLGSSVDRDGVAHAWLSRKNSPIYKGPVAILLDAGSLSGSEFFAAYMQEAGRAIVVGQTSAGSVLKQTGRKISGGGILHYSTHDFISVKGRRIEGAGVRPDVDVPLTRAALKAGRDVFVEAAELALTSGIRQRDK